MHIDLYSSQFVCVFCRADHLNPRTQSQPSGSKRNIEENTPCNECSLQQMGTDAVYGDGKTRALGLAALFTNGDINGRRGDGQ